MERRFFDIFRRQPSNPEPAAEAPAARADGDRAAGGSGEANDAAPASDRHRTIHAIVSGRVQGVGFRWSCMEEGERLGLVGEVRNLDDGDVEVFAQGPADDVARMIAWLYHGPRWASVASVRITDMNPGSLRHRAFIMGN
ncbi:acylphosphatase [Actinomyces sp. 565]|uniref:acylphosphatase n=1 Tax=Actinomyces sp. 565 TaxID=2057794 RepID=UPI0013A6E4A9|nr:acylphosphatase [Actinomyces sp. 565]NDR53777.1 acylphosphatase [Actinomyces sp. 565]